MKNVKKIALGLIAGAMAISFSAFTNAHSNNFIRPNKAVKAGMITDNYIVQPSLNDFVQLSSTPVSADCSGTATRQCAYDVTSTGKSNIPDLASYTGAEIDNYVSHGWLTPASGSSDALYQP
ncbi:hypothetical protein [Mucilaginibacter gotjawali]|uniref:Uncharacterized protein n=2 Tax=Mucilaginibacter gotjawali TaxID=1550579 RepID=A0A839SP67_9SPHI|nr:hypothetical protein [Mucilaginibacter gotjawali]MBB3058279.1 hypothetical protein [Mucilaginibacter gotjawali]BAU55602.1 hypothetical protein MgSA37_03793 [Mucilaginibacter gotjawali]